MNLRPTGYEPAALTTELHPHDIAARHHDILYTHAIDLSSVVGANAILVTHMDTRHWLQLLRQRATLNNIVLAVALMVVAASIWNTVMTLQKNFLLQQRVDLLEQQIKVTQLEVETLRLQQQYLQSPEYQELTARAKLGKANPGEKVINLPPLPPEAKPPSSQPVKLDELSNFDKWMRFFFGR